MCFCNGFTLDLFRVIVYEFVSPCHVTAQQGPELQCLESDEDQVIQEYKCLINSYKDYVSGGNVVKTWICLVSATPLKWGSTLIR